MLFHKTEYSIDNGLSWTTVTESEPVGPGKSIVMPTLDSGTYKMFLRITPTKGYGPPMISNPFNLVVATKFNTLGVVAYATVSGAISTSIQPAGNISARGTGIGWLNGEFVGTPSGSTIVTGNATMAAFFTSSVVASGILVNNSGFPLTVTDPTGPTITSFALTSTSGTSLTVNVSALTATDNDDVTPGSNVSGFKITESATKPLATDIGWTSTRPTTYIGSWSSSGTETLYAWTKDTSDNVSNALTATYTFTYLDTVPNAFTFTAQTGAALSTLTTSNTVTISGINTATPISITGGTYKINSGSYVSSAGTVNNNDTVTVQLTSSPSWVTPVSATVTIGGVVGVFTVTTTTSNALPTSTIAFSAFAPDSNVLPTGTVVLSNFS